MLHIHVSVSYLSNFFQIEAHIGSVNDLAFSIANKILVVISCGDDKLIKVIYAVIKLL